MANGRRLGNGGLAWGAAESDRAVQLWREANGLDTERKFLEALPSLFHPRLLGSAQRKRDASDPLRAWELLPGDPSWLDSPRVRGGLSRLWRAARRGESWPLPILERFAAAWTFRDRAAERAVSSRREWIDRAFVAERESLAAYLRDAWKTIAHERPTERSVRTALEKAFKEGRLDGWTLSRDPGTGYLRLAVARRSIDDSDVGIPGLIARALKPAGTRGPAPWKKVAGEALEDLYGRQASVFAPVDRLRQRRRRKLPER